MTGDDRDTGPPKTSDDVETTPPQWTSPPIPQVLPEAPRPDRTVVAPPEGAEISPLGLTLNDNYRVDRLIGTGGMGEVYEGEHLFTGNRVAIKMILRELSSDESIVSLFRREARILFQLADDAIVRYLDSFYHAATGRYCLVMQFIDGVPLADRIEETGPLPLADAVSLMRRLALGLGKAHSLGVTHRDLSPDNVMLRGGEVARAALIDFGIATAEDMSEGTLLGRFAGKYRYVAPEQLGLFKGLIGAQTDIYGLALMIAAAVRGDGLDMGRSFPEAVQAREAVPKLDRVPDRLRPLLARMLEPDPANRPRSMAEVVALLDDPIQVGAPAADQTVIAAGGVATAPRIALPPGASRPPETVSGGGATGSLGRPAEIAGAETTDGPFRLTAPPETPAQDPAPGRPSRWPLGVVLGLTIVAGGAWLVSRGGGDLDQTLPRENGTAAMSDGPVIEAPAFVPPPPDLSTREGFLADAASASCTYATRITAGAEAGRIARFAAEPGALPRLSSSYGEAFGMAPGIMDRPVTQAQCAALDLVGGLQGRGAVPPSVVLDAPEVATEGTVLGRVGQVRGRGVWLALVTASGEVFDLSSRLEPQADGSFLFGFQLSGAAVAAPEPQILLAVASADPLVAAAAAMDGASAEDLLSRLLPEASQAGAAAQIGHFMLIP
ncbi:MAG: protein kinase [Pseudomonadota bacterium]